MNIPKQHRETRQIELAETYNIMLSLHRINESAPYHHLKWKRALYHALSMSGVADGDRLKALREALELP